MPYTAAGAHGSRDVAARLELAGKTSQLEDANPENAVVVVRAARMNPEAQELTPPVPMLGPIRDGLATWYEFAWARDCPDLVYEETARGAQR